MDFLYFKRRTFGRHTSVKYNVTAPNYEDLSLRANKLIWQISGAHYDMNAPKE